MDVNITYMQDALDKDAKEKQCTEGQCFLCNKQGHLKWDCQLNKRKEDAPWAVRSVPMAQVMQVDKGENDEMEASTNEATLCDKEEIVSKLQRMSLTKWNDVINALINQEGF